MEEGYEIRLLRDATVEDEVINNGLFADTVFKCAGSYPSRHNEEVFGQAALFALLSPVLRDRLDLSRGMCQLGSTMGSAAPETTLLAGVKRDKHGRQEVWLADEISARGFREVARYVYGLPNKFNTLKIGDVMLAARILQIPELDQAALRWGISYLRSLAPWRGMHNDPLASRVHDGVIAARSEGALIDKFAEPEEGRYGQIGDALCFYASLCLPIAGDDLNSQGRRQAAEACRDAILVAFDCQEMSSNPVFLDLPEDALLLLFECEVIHEQPEHLWEHCVRWAFTRKDRELPPTKPTWFCSGPSFEKPAKKMFAPGARMVAVSVPEPADEEVDWQRWLLPIAERMRFKDMAAGAFAAHVEAIHPMLPELRQVIYRVRRQGIRQEMASIRGSPLLLEAS